MDRYKLRNDLMYKQINSLPSDLIRHWASYHFAINTFYFLSIITYIY